ncbi:hypothetical protein [Leucobacter sp. BZR 635]
MTQEVLCRELFPASAKRLVMSSQCVLMECSLLLLLLLFAVCGLGTMLGTMLGC